MHQKVRFAAVAFTGAALALTGVVGSGVSTASDQVRSSAWKNLSENWKWSPKGGGSTYCGEGYFSDKGSCKQLWGGGSFSPAKATIKVPEGCNGIRVLASLSGWAGLSAQSWYRVKFVLVNDGKRVIREISPRDDLKTAIRASIKPGTQLTLTISNNARTGTNYMSVPFKTLFSCQT